jgi:citrate lyase subunit beta/citryl-CoA lyase
MKPRRSVLYMPGANARALDKARSLDADALILDLEDSVAPEAKEAARALVVESLAQGGYGRRELIVRVNGLDTAWGQADMAAAAASSAHGILIPKVNGPADLARAAELAQGKPLWAMMETPRGVLQALAIADCGLAACFVIGTNDLIKESRFKSDVGRMALIPSLSTIVLAARSCGMDVIDGVYNDFKDEAGFMAECLQGVQLGMDGKTLIHPGQIRPANQAFAPSAADIDWAQRVISAFAVPEAQGKGVLTLDGRMVERLHLDMAQRVAAIAEAIGA